MIQNAEFFYVIKQNVASESIAKTSIRVLCWRLFLFLNLSYREIELEFFLRNSIPRKKLMSNFFRFKKSFLDTVENTVIGFRRAYECTQR